MTVPDIPHIPALDPAFSSTTAQLPPDFALFIFIPYPISQSSRIFTHLLSCTLSLTTSAKSSAYITIFSGLTFYSYSINVSEYTLKLIDDKLDPCGTPVESYHNHTKSA
jgi:hypothetical protein